MQHISDFMKQLYGHYILKKLSIIKKQKHISSDLIESFERQLTKEDISGIRSLTKVETNENTKVIALPKPKIPVIFPVNPANFIPAGLTIVPRKGTSNGPLNWMAQI